MSESYEPDPDVVAVYPYDTVFQSQRDLALTVPINFVTVPGVSFTAACFPASEFEDDNSGDCLSNLLAAGFRRFEIDLYWDEGRQLWSFCPIAIPSDITHSADGTETLSFSTSSAQLLTSVLIATASAISPRVSARQESSAFLSSAVLPTSALDTSSTITSPTSTEFAASTSIPSLSSQIPGASPSISSSDDDPLVKIGPYVCTITINLSTFTSQLLSFIHSTQDNVHAQVIYVIINIHASKSDLSPASPAPSPTSLPSSQNLISYQFDSNLSSYIYTPSNLRTDRTNLNSSWYSVPGLYRPADGYYETKSTQYGIVYSEDGWPTSYSVEFTKGKRLLLGWGSVDPQMSGYNFTGDETSIFPNGYIQSLQSNLSISSSDPIKRGCLVRGDAANLSVSQINSSWATDANLSGVVYPVSAISEIMPLLNLTTNTTNCGISSFLNATLFNSTAYENPQPYKDYAYATIWSWAYNEPKQSSPNTPDSLFRCATSNIIDLSGRWTVSDCSQKYYSACRALNQPYNWTIATYTVSYSYASHSCPDGYSFGVPRTALENSYLAEAIRSSHRDYDGHGVWIDLNSLDYKNCWVSGGPNATCPYKRAINHADDLRHKTVLVPALAALIVLIITSLTILVKFAGNRSTRKRSQKRANNGFIYEGVPS